MTKAPHSGGSPTLALINGKIISIDRADSIHAAVAISGNRIHAIGTSEEIRETANTDAEFIDLNGRAVVPGLIDGHAHMDREGLKSALPSLASAAGIDDIVQRIEALVAESEPGDWIVTMPIGEPPDYENVPGCLKENRFPNRHDLDRVSPNNPVYIRSIWGYWRTTLPLVSIANSEAMKRAGIDGRTTPPAPSVQIDRDFETGEPTGIFIEWNKMPVVEFTLMAAAPSFDVDTRTRALADSMRIYNSVGTTSVFEGHGVAGDVIAAYQRLADAGQQSVRAAMVFSPAWGSVDSVDVREMVRSWARWLAGRGMGDAWLRLQGLYSEVDDSLETRLRSAGKPQTGWAGFHYDAALPRDDAKTLLVEAARNGIRAVGILPYMLDLFREVDKIAPIAGQRWVFGHLGTLTSDEIAAIRDLGLAVTTHTSANIYKRGHQHLERLGSAREDEIVPLRHLCDEGVPVSLATDNVPVSLFHSIWHVVARRGRASDKPIAPGQALSRMEAIRCATMGGAYLSFEEDEKGSLEPGKLADLAVLSADPLACDEAEIPQIVADLTIVDGRVVHERNATGGRSPRRQSAAQSAATVG